MLSLNYKEFGQGKPIIILHGLLGMLDNWQTIAKKLAQNYSVYIVDLRNHGKSPHTDSHSYAEIAEDLQQFMEDNWIYSATVIGHSMGGKAAMQLAYTYPDLIEKLIVVDIAPKEYEPHHNTIFNALRSLDLSKVENRKDAEIVLKEQIDNAGVRQFLLKNLHRTIEDGYKWKMNLPVLYRDYQNVITATIPDDPFEKETLFVRGEKSDYISDKDFEAIQEVFPSSKLVTIPNAGHWIHAEQPKLFLEALEKFL